MHPGPSKELVEALVAAGRSILSFNATKLIEAFYPWQGKYTCPILEGQNPREWR
jgi:hypothetical protein